MNRWIEVPVPVDMVDEVRKMVMGAMLGGGPTWDPAKIDAHMRSLEPEGRELAMIVARGVLDGNLVEDADLAERFGVSQREVHGLVQEVNEPTFEDFPSQVVWVRHRLVPDADPPRSRCEVYMLESVASLISVWRTVNERGNSSP
jgi:hypothetical protein